MTSYIICSLPYVCQCSFYHIHECWYHFADTCILVFVHLNVFVLCCLCFSQKVHWNVTKIE